MQIALDLFLHFALCHDLHHPSFIIIHHKVSGSNISKITEFYVDIHTDSPCIHNVYDVTNYFQS